MPTENIHLLRHDIHSSFNTGDFDSDIFVERLASLFPDYPTGTSQNYHMYIYAMQEYNRKLDSFGLTAKIVEPVDAGFRPLDFAAFFSNVPAPFFSNVPAPGVLDFVLLENGSSLLQQNSSKLALGQDVLV